MDEDLCRWIISYGFMMDIRSYVSSEIIHLYGLCSSSGRVLVNNIIYFLKNMNIHYYYLLIISFLTLIFL